MNLLMVSGDRSILEGKKGAFYYTLQEFAKHWNRIDIITPKPKQMSNTPIGAPPNVQFYPNPQGLLSQPSWIFHQGKQIHTSVGCSVMTVHEYPPFYNGRGAAKLHRKTGIPYALEIHHIVGYPQPSSLQEKIGKIMSQMYLKHDARPAKAVRTVNHHVLTQLHHWGIPQEKLKMISSMYLDRDTIEAVPNPPIAYDIAFCARMVENKGFEELLDAFAHLPKQRMLVIGDGPLREKYEQEVRKRQLEGRITFTRWLPTSEAVLGAMKSARLLVMCSKSEGGPRVLVEAMACGIPVVATPVGIAPDIVENGFNGYLTTGQPQDIVQKVQLLLSDEAKRETMGDNARKVLETYDKKILVENYANFLKSLA